MPNIQPISKTRYINKRWKRHTSYAFTKNDATAPIVLAEFTRSAVSFPIAFVKSQLKSGEVRYFPVAILGFQKGQNLFVSSDGRWTGNYIPAVYRSHPFHLGRTQDGKKLLCFDEDSGLLLESEPSADSVSESFFSEAGETSGAVSDVLKFLTQIEDNKLVTTKVCDLLKEHQLIEPWPILIRDPQGERPLEGFFRVSESAMRKLSDAALSKLHGEDALMAAHCQMLSTQNLRVLGQLAGVRNGGSGDLPKSGPSGEIDFSFLAD
jgi:hypothetical protein